jgi:hypothetical protein
MCSHEIGLNNAEASCSIPQALEFSLRKVLTVYFLHITVYAGYGGYTGGVQGIQDTKK